MARNGLNMKDINEVRRLWKLGLTNRQIARATGAHRNTINKYVDRFRLEGASPENTRAAPVIDIVKGVVPHWCDDLDWEKIRSDFLSGISLNVIHEELLESNKIQVQYSGFWKQVKKKISLSEATMVRAFKPGERAEIDYADGIEVLDPVTGEIRKTQLFVGVLCHSRYAFAEFTWTQSSVDFLQSHVNMFDYFGGAPQLVSPDNLKSAVTKSHRYDPVINQAYTRLAEHYDIAVVPARVRRPKDKAIVERTIQIFQRYFYMKVRARTFTSLVELNQCLRDHLVIFNNKTHRIFKRTRQEMYLGEVPSLKPLPMESYKVAVYHRGVLGRDCHIQFDNSFYSAPHDLRGRSLDVWATASTVEIYSDGERVAMHGRTRTRGRFKTDTGHYPPSLQAYAEEDVQKIIYRAQAVGPETEKLIRGLLESPEPLRHLRRSQGILALSWKYGAALLETAAREANLFSNHRVQYLERVIKTQKGVQRDFESEVSPRSYNPHLRGTDSIH